MPSIGPFFTGAKQLSIDLTEPVVYLKGISGDRTTHVLQGEVSVILTKPIVATQVVIRFIGKSYILWPEGTGPKGNIVYHEKILHEQNLILQSFLPHSEGTLRAGLHRWPFQFLVSNQLTETIEDECGKVTYSMIATVHRSGVTATKLRARREILLLRTPSWSDSALTANSLPSTSIISERKLDLCDAFICIEKSSCSSGTQLPITLCLSPNVKHTFVESVSVVLTEKRVYKIPEYQARRVELHDFKLVLSTVSSLVDPTLMPAITPYMSLKEIHKALVIRNAHIPLDDVMFQQRLVYSLPNCVHLNHSSTYNEIHITHSLKIHIELSHPKSKERTHIRLETPITILDCRLKADYNILPTYEEAVLSDPIIDDDDAPKSTGFLICPCYIEYKKTNTCSKRDWMKLRNNTLDISDTPPPPSYKSILH
uniref:AlyA n=1 Tax=Syzygites megalocarpus TaxID=101119 RepID=G8G8T6_9FUNG|nr:AlyA [Syzygites megalocarpus]